MMRILLADDESFALDRLAVGIGDIPFTTVVGQARNGIDATAMIEELKPDLAILDVQMPGMTGIEVAASLATAPDAPEIVFVTAYPQLAEQAFEVDAVDYLMKPIRFDRLRQTLARAQRRRTEDEDDESGEQPGAASAPGSRLHVPGRAGRIALDPDDVVWIEAIHGHSLIHTRLHTYHVPTPLAELERALDPTVLRRVHKDAIVRTGAIRAVRPAACSRATLVLEDGSEVAAGASYIRGLDLLVRH